MKGCAIALCGGLSIEIDGVRCESALRGRQVPLLLAYLVLHRERRVGREELADALWPSAAPASQDAALRTLLSRLRSALPGARLGGREELCLELPEPVRIDLELAAGGLRRAEQALASGRPRSAWALIQEPLRIASRGLLPGAQAEWLEPHRRELNDLRLAALELLGRAALALGGPRLLDARRAARALIESERFHESAWALLIEALVAGGNPAEALSRFEQLRMLLREELGTTPGPEILALHERLLRGHKPEATAALADAAPLALPTEIGAYQGSLLGRVGELEFLRSAWRKLLDGSGARPQIVLLSGEPGIGKTRLIAEAARAAHHAGAIVLAGRAPREPLIPYQPLVEALRHHVVSAGLEELNRTLRANGEELVALVPELARRMPELTARMRELPLGGDEGAEAERYRLFEAFVGAFTAISVRAPLLLVLDDLQWADRATLLLLRHLARAPQLDRVLVLGAFRTGERAGEAFRSALSELRGERLVTQVGLEGLGEADAAELAGSLVGAAPAPALLAALHAQTEGNPFFVEEMVRALQASEVPLQHAGPGELRELGLPQGVRDVIAGRLDALARDALECLQAAAVIGRDFELATLQRVAAQEEDRFLGSLEAALEADLVRELPAAASPAATLRFSHVMIREALCESMSSARRARLRRRVGEALALASGPAAGSAALGLAEAGSG
jgi:DNA-binding SARP family transcriptional activator